MNKHHVTPASFYTLKFYAALHWSPLWSLSVEEQFYFFYPLIVKLLRNSRRIQVFLSAVVFLGIFFRAYVHFFLSHQVGLSYVSSFGAFDQIAIGGLSYFFWINIRKELEQKRGSAFFLVFSGITICLFIYVNTDLYDGLETTFTPSLMALGCALTILGGLHIPSMNSIG